MRIAIAGPYSASTPDQKQLNLDALNKVAAEVYKLGHVPIIGVNAALSIALMFEPEQQYEVIMRISMDVVSTCDALIIIGESLGANRERDMMLSLGKPVYHSLQDFISQNGKL